MKQGLQNIFKVLLPLVLGGSILYWMYRDFDFQSIHRVLTDEMNWTWMLLSLPFGILAQAFRGWRWQQTLEPLDEHPRASVAVNSVFMSYAVSLIIPRIGEFTRCGILKRWDGVSFPKALGTVVTERAVDALVLLLFTGATLLFEMSIFGTFFERTGTSVDTILQKFSLAGYLVTAVCGIAILLLLHLLLKYLHVYNKVKATLSGIWEGILSLRGVKNLPLFLFFTIGIWVCYFLHYYLTFFCFDFTTDLGMSCALVSFVVGSIAVIVPTPNGAGSWHFAVKTMLILYGVQDEQALYFVLIVHTLQTLLDVFLGIWSWLRLSFMKTVEKRSF